MVSLSTFHQCLLGCAVLTGLPLLGAVQVGAAPRLPTPPRAADPVSSFLPALVPALPDPLDPPLVGSDLTAPLPDVIGPSQAIAGAWQQALTGLTAGQAPLYRAVLDAAYTQTAPVSGEIGKNQIGKNEIGREETGRRLEDLLAKYRVSEARFSLTSCRLTGPDAVTVTVRERLTLFTRNTPPTRVPMPNGGVVLMNNTTRLETLLVLRQDWVRRGTGWKLRRSQMPQQLSAAVL